ncbi:hypothetical protein HDU97_007723 [Phlyctochytrium planicorne]|nr:hypothetical protein HDU97_007723 [Phlyctochytrium planicorne]
MPTDLECAATWERFKTSVLAVKPVDAVECLSTSDCLSMVWIPTGVKLEGSRQNAVAFLKNMGVQQRDVGLVEKVCSQTLGENRLVEECMVTIVHDSTLDWLLPDVKPTKKRVTMPMVAIVKFDDSALIQQVHYHWDQATVLRQLSVLPMSMYCKANSSDITLPVLGPKIVDPLMACMASSMAPAAEKATMIEKDMKMESAMPSVESSEKNELKEMKTLLKKDSVGSLFSQSSDANDLPIRPSSRVLQRPGGKVSDIFSSEPVPIRTSIPIDPRRFNQQIHLFGEDTASEASSRPFTASGRRDPNWSSAKEETVHRRRVYPNRDSSSLAFYGDGMAAEAGEVVMGKKMVMDMEGMAIKKKTSLWDLSATGDAEEGSAVAVAAEKPSLGALRNHNEESVEAVMRPSSRVLAPPGGRDNIIFG